MLPLRSVGRSNFDKGLHSLATLIKKRHISMRTAVLYIYIMTNMTYLLLSINFNASHIYAENEKKKFMCHLDDNYM